MREVLLGVVVIWSLNCWAGFEYDDRIYDPKIKTVLLYPNYGKVESQLLPPVVPISQPTPLVLHFDDLSESVESYYVRIINCLHDWTPSSLPDMDFLREFNEYPVNQYVFSTNTYVPYVHYTITLPRVKISGNYLLLAYKDADRDNPIFTRRFMVYESILKVNLNPVFSSETKNRFSHQQLDAVVSYSDYNLQNPNDLFFYIRQNNRWDNMKFLPPLYIKENEKVLDYRYFSGENTFPGLNEYRAFDIRSVQFSRMNVEERKVNASGPEVKLQIEKSRNGYPYEQYPDINGKFFVFKYETGDGMTDGDYVWVNFGLKSEEITQGKVYVLGGFNDWQVRDDCLMRYNKDNGEYQVRIRLKQGFYNYSFATVTTIKKKLLVNESEWEGSHSATENTYEGLVYYRQFGSRADRLIGYGSASTAQFIRQNR